MPCQYDETADEIAARVNARDKRLKREACQPYKKELDLVTRLLCEVMTIHGDMKLSPMEFDEKIADHTELQAWWKEHKKMDERREINERAELRTKALKKLTSEEKKALGLTK